MMIRIIFLVLLFPMGNLIGQTLDYKWGRSFGAERSDFHGELDIDIYGNIYSSGVYRDTLLVEIGDSMVVFPSDTSRNVYISKMDKDGEIIWFKTITGWGDITCHSIQVDSSLNVYLGGYWYGGADFDPGEGEDVENSPEADNSFVLKLDSLGDLVWMGHLWGTDRNRIYAFKMDQDENLLSAGTFEGNCDFNPGTGSTYVDYPGESMGFVQKMESKGRFLWVRNFNSSLSCSVYDLCTDTNSSIYLTGGFYEDIDVEPADSIEGFDSKGDADMFLEKLDENGNHLWTLRLGGTGKDVGYSVITDSLGFVYVGGIFMDTAVLYNDSTQLDTLIAKEERDMFLLRLTPDGELVWSRTMVGSEYDILVDLLTDRNNDLLVTGRFKGDLEIGEVVLESNGEDDAFIAKMDSSGRFLWAESYGGAGADIGNAFAVDSMNTIYWGGFFSDTISWESMANGETMISKGSRDAFVIAIENDFTIPVEKVIVNEQIRVYPNPNNGTLYMDLRDSGPVDLTLVDLRGREVWSESCSGNQIYTAYHSAPPGMYLLRVEGGKTNSSVKLIVK